jgi:energy-coupling factor transporter ATP-binding protein EcfA2
MTDTVQDLVQSPIETTSSPGSATSGKRTSQTAFANAEFVPRKQASSVAKKGDPITPLGHNAGNYYLIPPSGQLRKFSAESLESGRGVKSLLVGQGPDVEAWCIERFLTQNDSWNPKAAGLWIIERCNEKGVFDPDRADFRSVGVWRDRHGLAVAHCGNCQVLSDGSVDLLQSSSIGAIMVGAGAIDPPSFVSISANLRLDLLNRIRELWGWKQNTDADNWLGWVAAACLGGFPEWRSHLYVHGSRGSGKSKLLELAGALLGDLAGEVINDATEAGLRQSRNNEARPLLIDEFEPDENTRNASRQDGMLALFRRMSGGKGGRISRGGADHASKSFRMLGAAYVSSINHIQFEPQDGSRFVVLGLLPIPRPTAPIGTKDKLTEVFELCRKMSPQFRGRMLEQIERWDRTQGAISIKAKSMGADCRQADTASTILTGLDLFLFDGEINEVRLEGLGETMMAMISAAGGDDERSEGLDALDFLLCSSLNLDHGLKRTVRELLDAALSGSDDGEVFKPEAALARHGIYIYADNKAFAVRSGQMSPAAMLYANTKWRKGAHVSALLKINGIEKSASAVRFGRRGQQRVLTVPASLISGED